MQHHHFIPPSFSQLVRLPTFTFHGITFRGENDEHGSFDAYCNDSILRYPIRPAHGTSHVEIFAPEAAPGALMLAQELASGMPVRAALPCPHERPNMIAAPFARPHRVELS